MASASLSLQPSRLQLARDALAAGRVRAGAHDDARDLDTSNVVPLLRLRSQPRFCIAELVGHLAQLSGPAALTMAMGLVLDAQRAGEPVAWVAGGDAMFFPPDAVESGIDLDGLLVVRAPNAHHAARAGDRLLRSAGFGLLVLDLAADLALGRAIHAGVEVVPMALQARLAKLAQRHDAVVLLLTGEAVRGASSSSSASSSSASSSSASSSSASSLSSLVSLRAVATRQREGSARFRCTVQVGKDKRRGPGWRVDELCRAPAGLR